MSNDPERDVLRGLDAVEPTGSWGDVVARADRPATLDLVAADPRPRRGRVLAAAAVLLAVAAIAAMAVLARRDTPSSTASRQIESTASLQGAWTLINVTRGGKKWPVADVPVGTAPRVIFEGDQLTAGSSCGGLRQGPFVLENNAILVWGPVEHGGMPCLPTQPRPKGESESLVAFELLLVMDPVVTIDGDRLWLTSSSGDVVAELERDRSDGTAADPNGPTAMFGRRWTAVSIKVGSETVDPRSFGGLVLQFDGKRATFPGLACVGSYEGPLDGNRWEPTWPGDIDCSPPPASDRRDDAVVTLLQGNDGGTGAVNVSLQGDRLTLSSDRASIDFRESEDPAGIWGRQWAVRGIVRDGVTTGPVLTAIDAAPVYDLRQPGSSRGSGCNGWGIGARLDGEVLVGGHSDPSAGACADAALTRQDDLLSGVTTQALVLLQGPNLTLVGETTTINLRATASSDSTGGILPPEGASSTTTTSTGGDPATTTTSTPGSAAPTPELLGHRWAVVRRTVDGVTAPIFDDGPRPGLTIDASVSGRFELDGCNAISYDVVGEAPLRLAPLMQTLVGCPEDRTAELDTIDRLLRSEPTITGRTDGHGATLTVSDGSASIELRPLVTVTAASHQCTEAGGSVLKVAFTSDRVAGLRVEARAGSAVVGSTVIAEVDPADEPAVSVTIDVTGTPTEVVLLLGDDRVGGAPVTSSVGSGCR